MGVLLLYDSVFLKRTSVAIFFHNYFFIPKWPQPLPSFTLEKVWLQLLPSLLFLYICTGSPFIFTMCSHSFWFQWFDATNSSIPYDRVSDCKSGLGIDGCYGEQLEAFRKMGFLIQNLTWRNRKSKAFLPFQFGILANINSMVGILNEIRQENLGQFVLTRRLNQVLHTHIHQTPFSHYYIFVTRIVSW